MYTSMPDVPPITMGPLPLQSVAAGGVTGVHPRLLPGRRRDETFGRQGGAAGSQRHHRTQTYDGSGRLVESADPPIVNIRT